MAFMVKPYATDPGAGLGSGWAPPPASSPGNPPPTAPAPSPGATGGGYVPPPDYGSLLGNNPYVLQAQALGQEQLAALMGQLGASAGRALVNLGDYGLAKSVTGLNIPANVQGLVQQANQAGTSILSRLGHAHDISQARIPAVLAGRGLYRSGETGYQLGEENRSYGAQEAGARSQTLDYLNGLYQQYLQQQFGVQQNEMNAYMAAYQQAMAAAPAGQYPGAGDVPPPSTASTYQAPGPAAKYVTGAGNPFGIG